ncbi:MAG: hypothetical protein AB7V36_08850 [Bacteroidales bacterium]
MKHRLLLLITGLLIFLLAGLKQNRNEKIVFQSTQQSMIISIEGMNNVYTYDVTPHMLLNKNGGFGHRYRYIYDVIRQFSIVGELVFDTNTTTFASDGNDKCRRSNG